MSEKPKAELYTRYPLFNVLTYNGVTILHFSLGGIGIILGYAFSFMGTDLSWLGIVLGLLYLVFAFGQMYVLMPLMVCPNCMYYGMADARCISGKNLLSRKIAREGRREDFPKRAQGLFCHNNLYLSSLIVPILIILPALILNFSFLLLAIWAAVVGLLLFRFFFIFTRIACVHCQAKYECPNAERTGVREM